MKRLYQQASVMTCGPDWGIALDSRPARTPGGRALAVPSQTLAEAIAAEWAAQGAEIKPHTMALTRLATTALDRVAPERDAIEAAMLAFARSDLLCHRADQPADLTLRQQAGWQPILDWADETLKAPLTAATGILPIEQPAASIAALAAYLAACSTWRLTGAQLTCVTTGSLLLAAALEQGRLNAAQTFALSRIDEDWQIEKWGKDEEAADRAAALEADLEAVEIFLGYFSGS